jgi:hypothetical protein
MQREPIYAALFALLSGIPEIKYSSRRLRAFSDIGCVDQPALFMEQKSDSCAVVTRMPSIWTLSVDLLVYINTGGNDPSVVPSSVMNPIIDAVVARLVPPLHIGDQTLGGLVQRCRIDGTIEYVEGVQGDQAFAIIPVQILTPD